MGVFGGHWDVDPVEPNEKVDVVPRKLQHLRERLVPAGMMRCPDDLTAPSVVSSQRSRATCTSACSCGAPTAPSRPARSADSLPDAARPGPPESARPAPQARTHPRIGPAAPAIAALSGEARRPRIRPRSGLRHTVPGSLPYKITTATNELCLRKRASPQRAGRSRRRPIRADERMGPCSGPRPLVTGSRFRAVLGLVGDTRTGDEIPPRRAGPPAKESR
jgi:hypothetical protein